jgi:hypothetical protein
MDATRFFKLTAFLHKSLYGAHHKKIYTWFSGNCSKSSLGKLGGNR